MRAMQLGVQIYCGSLGLLRVRRTARRPLAVKPRGMECRYLAQRNNMSIKNMNLRKNTQAHYDGILS